MSYSDRFGNNPVAVSDASYRSVAISVTPYQFTWPQFSTEEGTDIAKLTAVQTAGANFILKMPLANQVANGYSVLLFNDGLNNFTVQDYDGNLITTINTGVTKCIYVTDNSTEAGVWMSFTFGTGTSQADAAALAGLGLVAINGLLNSTVVPSTKNANYTLALSDRSASIIWTGGSGTFSFPAVSTLTNGWYVHIKNHGSGNLVLDPNSTELIDGVSSLTLIPNESAIVGSTTTELLTYAYSKQLTNAFTSFSKSVAGNSNVTLTTTEAAYSALTFTGILTGNINVIFPDLGQWTVFNNTTGAFSLTVKTAAGTGVAITQGTRQIVYSNGTNMVKSVDSGTGTVTSVASGTGLTGGPITSTGTLAIADTAVTPGTYGSVTQAPVFTVNQQGQLTAAANVTVVPPVATNNVLKAGDTMTGALIMSNAPINFAKAPDTASGATTDVFAITGNYVKVTGNVTITSLGTATAGVMRWVLFDASLTLTHNATSQILPGGVNIVTAAGDTCLVVSEGSGNNRVIEYNRASGQPVSATQKYLGTVTAAPYTANVDITANIPLDDTIPQNTEGVEIFAQSYTPVSASSTIRLQVSGFGGTNGSDYIVSAIFVDGATDAVSATASLAAPTNQPNIISHVHTIPSGSTASRVYRVRIGPAAGGTTLRLNGTPTGRFFGGVAAVNFFIEEVI